MRYLLLLLFLFSTIIVPVTAQGCPDSQPLAFTPNSTGRVTPGYNNRLRDNPSTNASVIASIPGGALFTVTGEAQCADGYRWWPVTWEGQSGWTAEGVEGEYFLAVVTSEVPADLPTLDNARQLEMWGYGVPVSTAWSGSSIAVMTTAGILRYDADNLDNGPVFLPPQSGAFTGMALNPANPDQLLTGDSAGATWLWNGHQASLFQTGIGSPRFSPDGSQIIARSGASFIVWDAASGAEIQTIALEAEPEARALLNPDQTRIALQVGDVIQILDLEGEVIAEVQNTVFQPYLLADSYLLGSDSSGYMYLQSLETGEIQTYEPAEPDTPATPSVIAALSLPDGRLLTSMDSVWNFAELMVWTPDDISQPLASREFGEERYYRVAGLSPSPDFSRIAAIASYRDDSRSLIILDAESFEVVYESAPFPEIDTLAASNVSLAYSPKAGEITVHDIDTGAVIEELTYDSGHAQSITLSADGNQLVFCAVPVDNFLDWSPDLFGFDLRESSVGSVWLSYFVDEAAGDALSCAYVVYDEGRRDFLVDSYRGLYTVHDQQSVFQWPEGIFLNADAVYIRDDLLWLVGARGVFTANLSSGELAEVVEPRMVNETGQYRAAASDMHEGMIAYSGGTTGTTVYVYDTASGQDVFSFEVDSPVGSLVFSPDGASFITGHDNGQILRWKSADGESLGQVGRVARPVTSLVFAADRLYSAGQDDVARVWSLK